jgi:hypothetical protein
MVTIRGQNVPVCKARRAKQSRTQEIGRLLYSLDYRLNVTREKQNDLQIRFWETLMCTLNRINFLKFYYFQDYFSSSLIITVSVA